MICFVSKYFLSFYSSLAFTFDQSSDSTSITKLTPLKESQPKINDNFLVLFATLLLIPRSIAYSVYRSLNEGHI